MHTPQSQSIQKKIVFRDDDDDRIKNINQQASPLIRTRPVDIHLFSQSIPGDNDEWDLGATWVFQVVWLVRAGG